ncbi:hypothetical protein [Fusibacter sp. 3D3]|uniref:hypothetical protein n=1 Tax=Fusibacter sp. 3D3 TaxID=1048380 RepID=UPI0008533002|nr:hypothetical protein [Fusibacter sp. 3D3]GAU76939.1 hypothetical protein F3D3_1538 [Fusibacter sp. 3D3]
MNTQRNQTKLLSSLAVFRELYNSKKDYYQIIETFINYIIHDKRLHNFKLIEISNLLNETFEFEIPVAIVNSTISKMSSIQRIDGKCYVQNVDVNLTSEVDVQFQESQIETNTIIDALIKFVEEQKNIKITAKRKHNLQASFCSFLLNEVNDNEYNEYVSAFIISNSTKLDFSSNLEKIKEGVILYSGLKHESDYFDANCWKNELVIFCDVEILFHLAGYNGELYKIFLEDFLKLVSEINEKVGGTAIKLKYFEEVKREIDGFFTKAKYLLDGDEQIDPSNVAMNSILNGCGMPSDILEKKTDFFITLEKHNIYEAEYQDFYCEENQKFNLISEELIRELSTDFNDIDNTLKILNYIAILRKRNGSINLRECEYIFLTGTTETLKIAKDRRVKSKEIYKYAINLFRITEELWYVLNKGFGNLNYPKSFNVISKSQTILSTIIRCKVSDKFFELKKEANSGKLSEELAIARLIHLKSYVMKPEEITKSRINDALSLITEDSINKFIEEEEVKRNRIEILNKEIANMKSEINEKSDVIQKSTAILKKLLNEKKTALGIDKTKLRDIKNRVIIYKKIIKILTIFVLFFYYFIGFKNQILNDSGTYSWKFYLFLGLTPIIVTSHNILFRKEFNPIKFFNQFDDFLEKRVLKIHSKLVNKISVLEKEICEIETDLINSSSNS